MGHSTQDDEKMVGKGLRQVLGRIFRPRHAAENALPFLLIKERTVRVELQPVIDAIIENQTSPDGDILRLVGVAGVRPADIEIVRAYIHRFGTDLANPLTLDAHRQRTLLLDENTPQTAMLHLSQNFGWATHVSAEGLAGRDTPDQDIWEFARAQKFAAIVTRDTDFFYIQRESGQAALEEGDGNIPLLIFVPETLTTETLSGLFDQYAKHIRGYITQKSHLACSLGTEQGCRPLHL